MWESFLGRVTTGPTAARSEAHAAHATPPVKKISRSLTDIFDLSEHTQDKASDRISCLNNHHVRIWLTNSRVFKGVLRVAGEDLSLINAIEEDPPRKKGRREFNVSSAPEISIGGVLAFDLCHLVGLSRLENEDELHHKCPYANRCLLTSDPPKVLNLRDAAADLARRLTPRLRRCLEQRKQCHLLACGLHGQGSVEGLLLCMSALDIFLEEHHHLDVVEIRRLITIHAWIVDYTGVLYDYTWPDEFVHAPTGRMSFQKLYEQELSITLDLREFGPHDGKELHVLINAFQDSFNDIVDHKDSAGLVAALILEVGFDLLIDVDEPFRSGAVNPLILFNILRRRLPTDVPLLYAQSDIAESFDRLPYAQHFHKIHDAHMHHVTWTVDMLVEQQLPELQRWLDDEKSKADLMHMPFNAYMHHRLHGNRHDAYIIHCIENGWIKYVSRLPLAYKLELAEIAHGVQRVPATCLIGELARDGPKMESWNRLAECIPSLAGDRPTYASVMAALFRVRMAAMPQPPPCLSPEPQGTWFANHLLTQMAHAWIAYQRFSDVISDLRVLLENASEDELVAAFSVRPPRNLQGHSGIYGHFLGVLNGGICDIIFWFLMCESGEKTLRALLPWAGIPSYGDLANRTMAKVMSGAILNKSTIHPDTRTVFAALTDALVRQRPASATATLCATHGKATRGLDILKARSAKPPTRNESKSPPEATPAPQPRASECYIAPANQSNDPFDNTGARMTLEMLSDKMNTLMSELTKGRQNESTTPDVGQPAESDDKSREIRSRLFHRFGRSAPTESIREPQAQAMPQTHPEPQEQHLQPQEQPLQVQQQPQRTSLHVDKDVEAYLSTGLERRRSKELTYASEVDNALNLASALRSATRNGPDLSSKPTNESQASNQPTPLPSGWEVAWSEQHKRNYYFKRSTGERVWRRPVP